MVRNAARMHVTWAPSAYTAFKTLLTARLCAAIWCPISDCDETFNYWEQVHFLMYGFGFQTWEYSPAYAIRSYAYIWVHALPLQLYTSIVQANKVLVFYFLRCILAFWSAFCEMYFYKGVCKYFGANTGRTMLAFLVFSTGMFISSTALLPSSFSMYMTMISMGAWFLGQDQVAVCAVAASAILGWPFAGMLGLPLAYDMVFKKKQIMYFTKWCFIALVLYLVPSVCIDTYYYGRLVMSSLNIVLYNIFSEHGPDIYGVEPWYFYFLNGFLNFNIIFILGIVCLPFTFVLSLADPIFKQIYSGLQPCLRLGGVYLWILVFFTRPHKEERFLFPVYPLLCLAASVTVDFSQKAYAFKFVRHKQTHYTNLSKWLPLLCVAASSLLSVSRSIAIVRGYHAPLDVYAELNTISTNPQIHRLSSGKNVNICVGKEWYRFPSSYFLPNERWQLKFIKSNFAGQLPKPYRWSGVKGTRAMPSHMNNLNLEEPTRYTPINQCHYMIDLDLPRESFYEPRYTQQKDEWLTLGSHKFLDAARSHRLFRAFYIPFLSDRYCEYSNYTILQTTRTKNRVTTPHRHS